MTEITKEILLNRLNALSKLNALVIGDVILDRYIWGDSERISPEAPIPIVNEERKESRLGGAANVVRNLRALGVNVELCGYVGDDLESQDVFALLKADDVNVDGMFVERSRPTSVKTRVIARNQQMLRIDRENKTQRSPAMCEGFAALVEASIKKADFVIVSDYAKGVVSEVLIDRLEKLQASGELGMKNKPLFFDPHPDNYSIYRTVSFAKPNRKEAERAANMKIAGKEDAIVAAKKIMEQWNSEMMMVTLGADGVVIVQRGDKNPICLDTVARNVFDVSGAGDTVTAVFSSALTSGATAEEAGVLANIAAGVVIGEVGTAPIDLKKLENAIEDCLQ